jgi:hypothetical protein
VKPLPVGVENRPSKLLAGEAAALASENTAVVAAPNAAVPRSSVYAFPACANVPPPLASLNAGVAIAGRSMVTDDDVEPTTVSGSFISTSRPGVSLRSGARFLPSARMSVRSP